MKGKKGSKGNKVYFTEYYPACYMQNYVPGINLLSLQEGEELQSIASEKVVIDTGATESVAGVASMSRLVDGGRFQYSVLLDDRPRFRFGNGRLAGAQDQGQVVGKFTRDLVEWTSGLKRLQNDPFSVWPGRDQDDHRGDGHSPPGDDDEGDGNDPHRGSKRRAIQFWEFGWCCHPVGSYGGPQEVAHGEDLRSASASPFAKTEEYVSPSYLASPDVLVKEESKGKVH